MAWNARNAYLTAAETEENAGMVYGFLYPRGWTINAIAALCGNMQVESGINPGIWENLQPYVGGYGLTQWTPYTKLADWATGQGLTWLDNGDTQCERIDYEALNNLQWFYNAEVGMSPPITFTQFTTSTLSVDTLAMYFLYFYEHPADPGATLALRQSNARYWYEKFSQQTTIPIWLLFKFNDWRRLI